MLTFLSDAMFSMILVEEDVSWGLGDASHMITMDSGILADLHKVREAAGEERGRGQGRGGGLCT